MSGDALSVAEAARFALEALEGGEPCVSVVVVEGGEAGRRTTVWQDRAEGSLGRPELDRAAWGAARELLAGSLANDHRSVETAGGSATLYLEAHRPPDGLVIVGAGHIARPLCKIGALLGLRVSVLDDRPEFAARERFPEAYRVARVDFSAPFASVALGPTTHLVLVTRGHKYDYDALKSVLLGDGSLGYVGMVGSRRRVRAAFEQLVREGVPVEKLTSVYSPVGLDIGAETPEEIALAVAAEIVRHRRGGSGRPLRDVERVVERWIGEKG
ncbi:MAG: XdhC family protein [Longimicrobiaceae bacterium]